MVLKTIPNFIDYINWQKEEPGSVYAGFFKEWRPSDKKGYQPTIILEAMDGETLYGMAATKLTTVFVGNPEKNIAPTVLPGWYVEIKYLGSKEIATGDYKGSNAHQFEIAYDDERLHPVFGGSSAAREPVEYKAPAEAEKTPDLAKPEQATPKQSNVASSAPASSSKPARRVF